MSLNNKTNRLIVSIITVSLLLFQPAIAQRNNKDFYTPAFKPLNDIITQQQKTIGNDAIVMVWTDTLVLRKQIGDFTPRTPAAIGDASSWLTAALVMAFVDDGKISLDDKVSKYIPAFELYRKNYITIRQCLSHQTGIQYEDTKLKKLFAKKKFASLEEMVNDYASKEIQTNPGTEMRYSPIGISIAGRVLEVVAKKKFDQLIRLRLFRPLGMRNTTFSTIDASAVNPTSGARSTADDYMKFLVMLLNKGQYNGQQILSEASVNELLQIQQPLDKIKYAPEAAQHFPYALGSWVINTNNSGKATAFSSLSFGGTVPILNIAQRYAVLFLVKDLRDEPKIAAYEKILQSAGLLTP